MRETILKGFLLLIGFHLYLGIENGVVLPNDPYVYIGNNLTLHCNLTKYMYHTQYQSSKLMFLRKYDEVIPKQYVTITSTRSIMLRFPILSPDDGGNYECKLNGSDHQRPVSIGNQHVYVEYEPQPIEEINCRVYNWENMTCSWDLGVDFVHPNTIEIQLVWAISSHQFDCPHLTRNSCSWLYRDGLDSFIPDKPYYMGVTIKNNATKPEPTYYPDRPKVIKVETSKIVEPAPVVALRAEKNSTCIRLLWSHERVVREKVYRIHFKAKSDKKWQTKHVGVEETWTECSFKPFTEYLFNVSCKPRMYNGKVRGFWSKDATLVVNTDEDVPSKSPEIGPGSYVETPCLQYCKKVTLYWKPLSLEESNGNISHYRIDYTNLKTNKTSTEKTRMGSMLTERLLMLVAEDAYVIQIKAATGRGLSESYSQIYIPPKIQKPVIPNHIVEMHNTSGNTVVEISWEVPKVWTSSHWRNITSFTVYWCQGYVMEKHCQTAIESAEVPVTQTVYHLKIDRFRSYMFGVAANADTWKGVRISSGFQWNTCTFVKNTKPEIAPANVHLSAYQPNRGLQLEWDKITCHDTQAYIQHYEVKICRAETSLNCTGGVSSFIVKNSDTSFLIPNLVKGSKYRLWMSAVSERGVGPASESLYATVIDRRLNTGEIVGIVIGGLFIMIIFFLGIIICCRRVVRTVKQKYFEPIPIIMPSTLPPLPPIPMPQRKLSPDSDTSDGIYEKIDGPPSPCSSTESTTGVEAPLITSKWNILHLKEKFYKKSRHSKSNNDSGRSSLSHSADTLLMRLHPAHIRNSKRKYDEKSGSDSGIISEGRGKVYGYTGSHLGADDQFYGSDIHSEKTSTVKHVVNPYGCVNIVDKIDSKSEQFVRKDDVNICTIKQERCNSQRGSTCSLPVQSLKSSHGHLQQPFQHRDKTSALRLDLNNKSLLLEKYESGEEDSIDGTIDSFDDHVDNDHFVHDHHVLELHEQDDNDHNDHELVGSEFGNQANEQIRLDDHQTKSLTSYMQFMNSDNHALGEMRDGLNFSVDCCACNAKQIQIPVVNGYVTEDVLQNIDRNGCTCYQAANQKTQTLTELRKKFPREFGSNGFNSNDMEHNLPSHFFNSLSRNQADPARTTEL